MTLKTINAGIFDLGAKNIDTSKLPITIKDKVLMAPGTWNGETYSEAEISLAFHNMDWKDKDSIGIVADHASVAVDDQNANAGLSVHDWFGFVRNARLDSSGEISNVPGAIIGDLELHDSQIAQKLVNAGAKFGISPRVYGAESTPGVITDFSFKHFAIVTNPAISKAYINLSKKEDLARGEGKGVGGEPQGDGGADKCVCPKCGYTATHEKGTPCSDIKCPKCGAQMAGKASDMSEESQSPVMGNTSLKGGLKEMQEKKLDKSNKAEDLSTQVDKLTDQVSKLTSIVEKTLSKDMKKEKAEEEPVAEESEKEEAVAEEAPAEVKEAKEEEKEEAKEAETEEEPKKDDSEVKDMARKLEETTARLKDLEKQMNTPEKAAVKKDLSANSNPMVSGYSKGDHQMSDFLQANYS